MNLPWNNYSKKNILDKCQEFIEKSLDIGFITNKLLEINFLKKIFMSKNENLIFDNHIIKDINFSNLKKSEDYINLLLENESKNLEKEENEKSEKRNYDKKERLVEHMNRFYM